MQRTEGRGFRRALRCLRRQLCLCAKGEPTERYSDSEYTTTDATASEPASLVSVESDRGQSDTTLHTTRGDQASTSDVSSSTSDQSTHTLAPTVERSSPVTSSSPPDKSREESPTAEDDRVIATDQNTSVLDRTECDETLKKNVKDYVHRLMERVMIRMSTEEAGDASLVQDNSECKLTQGTLESSGSEYYSCLSEIITTDSSRLISSTAPTEEQTGDKPRSPAEEQTGDKPTEEQTGDEPRSSTAEQTGDKPRSSMEEQTGDEPRSSMEEQTGDEPRFSTDEQTRNGPMPDLYVCPMNKSFDGEHGEKLVKKVPTSQSDDCVVPDSVVKTLNKPQRRSSVRVSEVRFTCGLLGLGLTLGSDDLNDIVVQRVRMFSPAATQGDLRVGDRILKVNGTSVIGKSPSQVQRQLSGVKWGEEVKMLAMPPQQTVAFHYSEVANAGVIIMKLKTSADNPLGVDVEGGSDTECPYVRISCIKPGSIAYKCGILRVGDELVQIDQHLMVGTTHSEATDILRHINKPITLTVQRRRNLNLKEIVRM